MNNLLIKSKSRYFPSVMISCMSLLLCGIVYYIYYYHPVAYVHLIVEDSWGEYGTFICYLLSSFILLWSILRNPDLRKPGYILLALCFFIMAMEEVSWLQRILEIKTPGELVIINNQDELNFHNIKYVKHTKKVFSFLIILWAIVLPYIHKQNGLIKKVADKMGIPVLPYHLIPIFVLALFFFIAMPIPKYDEINELIFAIGFTWYAVHLLLYSFNNSALFSTIQKTAPVLLTVIILFSTGFLSNTWPYTRDLKWRFNQFATEVYFADGKYDQAGKLYRHILNCPELINESTLYNYALYLNKTGQNSEAKTALQKALIQQQYYIIRHPFAAKHHIITAQIYALLGDHSKSLMHLNEAISIYTGKINSVKGASQKRRLFLELGDLYLLSKEFQKAASNYKMAFSAASSKKERDHTIQHIQNLISMNLQDDL